MYVNETFDMDKVGETRRHQWKERLNIIVNFPNVKVLTERRYSSAKLHSNLNVWCVCLWWGGGGGGRGEFVPPTIQTSVKFRVNKFQQITFKLGSFINL